MVIHQFGNRLENMVLGHVEESVARSLYQVVLDHAGFVTG